MTGRLRSALAGVLAFVLLLTCTGCGGDDDFVSVAVVEVPETETQNGILSRFEAWFYDLWYTFLADERTRDAVDEAVGSYEEERGPIA